MGHKSETRRGGRGGDIRRSGTGYEGGRGGRETGGGGPPGGGEGGEVSEVDGGVVVEVAGFEPSGVGGGEVQRGLDER